MVAGDRGVVDETDSIGVSEPRGATKLIAGCECGMGSGSLGVSARGVSGDVSVATSCRDCMRCTGVLGSDDGV